MKRDYVALFKKTYPSSVWRTNIPIPAVPSPARHGISEYGMNKICGIIIDNPLYIVIMDLFKYKFNRVFICCRPYDDAVFSSDPDSEKTPPRSKLFFYFECIAR